ncbi:putative ripening-related protein 6 [Aegilops tauschii subsp. strangulata]|uniref:putative ripening-related protein 6 n=1 Tax=Aegilops tauschii subsp. strangulata TaxID=200361 RepID=UPI003CC8D237
MGNNTKVMATFGVLVFLQAVSCAMAWHHADPRTSLAGVQAGMMMMNGYEEGDEGGGPTACGGIYHGDGDFLMTLPAELYAGGALCHRFMNMVVKKLHVDVGAICYRFRQTKFRMILSSELLLIRAN